MIQQRLADRFSPSQLDVIDEGYLHVGHEGAKNGAGHFAVRISAPLFAGKSVIECHRLIYDALADWMGAEIHALRIVVLFS